MKIETLLNTLIYFNNQNLADWDVALTGALENTANSLPNEIFSLNNHWEAFDTANPLHQSPLQDVLLDFLDYSELTVLEFGIEMHEYLNQQPSVSPDMEIKESCIYTSRFSANLNKLNVVAWSIAQPLFELSHADQQRLFPLAKNDYPVHGFTQQSNLDMEMLYMAIRIYQAHEKLFNALSYEGIKSNLVKFFEQLPDELKNKAYTFSMINSMFKLARVFILLKVRDTLYQGLIEALNSELAGGYNSHETLELIRNMAERGHTIACQADYAPFAQEIKTRLPTLDSKKKFLDKLGKPKGIDFKPQMEMWANCMVLLSNLANPDPQLSPKLEQDASSSMILG